MVQINILKGKMVERGVTSKELAEALEINTTTLWRRLKDDGAGLRINDAKIISDKLKLTKSEFNTIFCA